MGSKRKLNSEERDFFSRVYKAAYTNPFSDERVVLDLEIAGLSAGVSRMERINKALEELAIRIKYLENEDRADFNCFADREKELVKNAFIFDFFYKYRNKFDQLILDQIKAGNTPIRIPFFNEAVSFLQKRGFNAEDTRRYFELGYQFRRAFFFIDRRLIGRSPVMKKLRFNLWNNIFTHSLELYDRYLWNRMEDFSTLILGGTGTGKGTAAMAIGRSGFIPLNEKKRCFEESFTRSFVSLNLSQFSETLIESELFGHRKGAFTGAVNDYKGVFDRCSPYGAILLDEIGELSIPIQIKLLQVLQERAFSPVGSHQKSRFQGRVIAATNRSIHEIRNKKLFRDDFYYRLCSDIIMVPSLRERIQEDPGELNDLLAYTVKRTVGKTSPELVEMVSQVIAKQLGENYPWPGNVRELEQCVRRVILKRNYEGDVKVGASDNLKTRLSKDFENGNLDAQTLLTGYCFVLYQRYGTFEEVARRTSLDRRTVKKYITEWQDKE